MSSRYPRTCLAVSSPSNKTRPEMLPQPADEAAGEEESEGDAADAPEGRSTGAAASEAAQVSSPK